MTILKKNIQKIANEHDWIPNPDDKALTIVIKGLNRNLDKHGKPYCPCRKEKTEENICPCVNAAAEIAKDGHCKCYLFFKKDE